MDKRSGYCQRCGKHAKGHDGRTGECRDEKGFFQTNFIKIIKEKELRESIQWILNMKGWERTRDSIRKTRKITELLENYCEGKISVKWD